MPADQAAAPDDWQAWLLEKRAEVQQLRDEAATVQATTELDELTAELDGELAKTGIRGKADPGRKVAPRRQRSTRRRQDAPDLPRKKISPHTTGKIYTSPDGKRFRPSMFRTLTCDTYGKVTPDGTPADPGAYDYERAARDAVHFAALFDRFIQNLRRFLGEDLQYFAAIEPQKHLAPHVHLAIQGTMSRAELRQVIAATFSPGVMASGDEVMFDADQLPAWQARNGTRTWRRPGRRTGAWPEKQVSRSVNGET